LRRRLLTRKKRADRLAELLVELAAGRTQRAPARRTSLGISRS
jgi:hypothetical protein